MATHVLVTILVVAAYAAVAFVLAAAISLHKKPASAIAWILAMVLTPILGILAFLLFGFGRLPKRRREKQREVNELMLERTTVRAKRVAPATPPWLESAVILNETLGSLPMLGENKVALIHNYNDTFRQLAFDIDQAQDFVHLEFYILARDHSTEPVFKALERAAQRGVTIRVLFDFIACRSLPGHKQTLGFFDSLGIQWAEMLPIHLRKGELQRPDLRNHRKLAVIDGQVGYTGSQNLIDDSYLSKSNIRRGLHWLDLMMRLEGPVVQEIDAVFLTDWFSETDELLESRKVLHSFKDPALGEGEDEDEGSMTAVTDLVDMQIVPSGPSFENDNNLKLFVLLIQSAQDRISITSPYFVPDEAIMMALTTAAARGVSVELFVSEIADQFLVGNAQRSYYAELMRAGISIYFYRAPTVLHAKHVSFDDQVAIVGSSNMDIRSFSLNMEISALLHSRQFVDRLRLVEDSHRANSSQLDPAEWARRPWTDKLVEGLARLTSAML